MSDPLYEPMPPVELTFCRDCDRVHGDTRKEEKPWEWRCLAKPIAPGFGFVSPDYSPSPPYARCSDVNRDGRCPYFMPARIPPQEKAA